MTYIVGLTGNIGSGKSTICRVFSILNIPIFSADLEAKKILHEAEVTDLLKSKFGQIILAEDEKIDNKKLASIVFSDKKRLEELNQIIHPRVHFNFKNWLTKQTNSPYVIMEAAILFESGFNHYVDYSINVHADIELRLKRVVRRDGANRKDVLARINNQISDEEKIQLADTTIYNNENQLVLPQVLNIHQSIITRKRP